MSEDSEENNLLQALEHYREGLSSLAELSDNAEKAFQMMLETLIARDEIEAFRGKLSAKYFLELDVLDEALKSNRDKLFWITWFAKRLPVKLRQYRKLEVYERRGWWWQCTYHISFWKYVKSIESSENRYIAAASRKIFEIIIFLTNPILSIWIRGKRSLRESQMHRKIVYWFRKATRELHRLSRDVEVVLSPVVNQFDWLWKLLTIACLISSLCLLINALPRFWAAGVTPEGVVGIVLPSVLTFILGKDTFEQITNGYGILEKLIKRMPFRIAPVLRQEVAFLISVGFLCCMLIFHGNLDKFADCYYSRSLSASTIPGVHFGPKESLSNLCKTTFFLSGTGKASDGDKPNWIDKLLMVKPNYSLADAENDLQRTISIEPDHGNAHFYLGWIYELRQDIKKAEAEYGLAVQNEHLLARIRLASLYINESNLVSEKTEGVSKQESRSQKKVKLNLLKATTILMPSWTVMDNAYSRFMSTSPSNRSIVAKWRSPSLEDVRSYFVTLAHIRVEQQRLDDAKDALISALQIHKKIIDVNLIQSSDIPENTSALCIYGEYLRLQQSEAVDDKLLPPLADYKKSPKSQGDRLDKVWFACSETAEQADPDDDFWLTRVSEYLPKESN